MSTSIHEETFEDRLLPMLRVAVVERQESPSPPRRRRFVPLAALITGLAVAATIAGGIALGRGGTVEIDARDALRDPAGLVARLQDAGIRSRVVTVPVMASGEHAPGTWVKWGFDRPNPLSPEQWRDLTWSGGPILELPKDVRGIVTLFVAREAALGEAPAAALADINELGATGDFWCLGLEAIGPAEATRVLEGLGYEVKWEWRLPTDADGNSDARLIQRLPSDAALIYATRLGPDGVVLRLMAERHMDTERQFAGTPSAMHPRSTWESWAPTCG